MSFVPAPQQANAAVANNNATVNSSPAANADSAEPPLNEKELMFKHRTFDLYWVDKTALMYKDGYAKVCPIARKES